MHNMSGYTKLFSTIIGSTVWRESDHVRLVWITMLAAANRYGEVECSVPGLADFARVSREQCDNALLVLSAPDGDSRTKTDEGRRIEAIDGGWRIINHGKYREKMSADDRREYQKLKMREYRARIGSVDTCGQKLTELTQAEAEAEADTEAKADTKAKADAKTPVAVAVRQPVQGTGAYEPNSLPRNHIKHAICGPAYRLCLLPWQRDALAGKWGSDADTAIAAVKRFVREFEQTVADGPLGDFRWLEPHFGAWMEREGRKRLTVPTPAEVLRETRAADMAKWSAEMEAEEAAEAVKKAAKVAKAAARQVRL